MKQTFLFEWDSLSPTRGTTVRRCDFCPRNQGRHEGTEAAAILGAPRPAGPADVELRASGYHPCSDRGKHPPSRPAGEPDQRPQGAQTDAVAPRKWYSVM